MLDRADGYGWVSIALHWLAALLVVTLWMVGQSIEFSDPRDAPSRRALHVSIGAIAWIWLAARIGWRWRHGHPRTAGLSAMSFAVARATHVLLLITIATMLVSGPLMVWAGGDAIEIFSAVLLPSPFSEGASLAALARRVHGLSATVLVLLSIVHVSGALFHLMFRDDDSFVAMLWPARRKDSSSDI